MKMSADKQDILRNLLDIKTSLEATREGNTPTINEIRAYQEQLKIVIKNVYKAISMDNLKESDPEREALQQTIELMLDDIIPLFFQYWLKVCCFFSLFQNTIF